MAIQVIQRVSPLQNVFIDRLNGPFCEAVLDAHISQVSILAEEWMEYYERYRPQEASGDRTPEQCEKECLTAA
ncbi:MAG TPA: hypothetical protein EYN71_04185 [Flavobacteriales bacterium]|nr:hypothetical protein [Flavobacteriales bacterium]HIO67606.1 hypothetical protein [Flavobacteriales bacterium]